MAIGKTSVPVLIRPSDIRNVWEAWLNQNAIGSADANWVIMDAVYDADISRRKHFQAGLENAENDLEVINIRSRRASNPQSAFDCDDVALYLRSKINKTDINAKASVSACFGIAVLRTFRDVLATDLTNLDEFLAPTEHVFNWFIFGNDNELVLYFVGIFEHDPKLAKKRVVRKRPIVGKNGKVLVPTARIPDLRIVEAPAFRFIWETEITLPKLQTRAKKLQAGKFFKQIVINQNQDLMTLVAALSNAENLSRASDLLGSFIYSCGPQWLLSQIKDPSQLSLRPSVLSDLKLAAKFQLNLDSVGERSRLVRQFVEDLFPDAISRAPFRQELQFAMV